MQPGEDRIDVLHRRRVRRFRREAMIHGIDRASQLRREEPILHILHFRRAHHVAAAMDVQDNGQWAVGRDRAIGQNADRLCAKRTLDVDLAGSDIGQVRFRNGG
jgi:hypothetical protein